MVNGLWPNSFKPQSGEILVENRLEKKQSCSAAKYK